MKNMIDIIKCDFCDDEMHFFICILEHETRYYCIRHWFERMVNDNDI